MKMVFDSSSIILLAKISMLNIATQRFECIITKEVKNECLNKDSFDSKMISKLVKENFIKVVDMNSLKSVEYEFRLGKGEASSLALAAHEKTAIATDDKAAIKACKILGIEFVTSIDFVLRAQEKGKITKDEARTKIMKLDEYGRYGTEIIKKALEKSGDKSE